jgi:hypothetical protein
MQSFFWRSIQALVCIVREASRQPSTCTYPARKRHQAVPFAGVKTNLSYASITVPPEGSVAAADNNSASLARPAGNEMGVPYLSQEEEEKRVEEEAARPPEETVKQDAFAVDDFANFNPEDMDLAM